MALGEIESPTFTEVKLWQYENTNLKACNSCGAVMTEESQRAHERWHKGIARDIRRAGKTTTFQGDFARGGTLDNG